VTSLPIVLSLSHCRVPATGGDRYRAYLRRVATSERKGTAFAVLVYTLLRIALFAVVWVVVELVTPIHGLWAAVTALLISGAISVILLDRQRNKVGLAAGRFFGRINERIEASARAEDDDDLPLASPTTTPASGTGPDASGDGKQDAQKQPVGEQEDAGLLEGGDQRGSERTPQHDAQG